MIRYDAAFVWRMRLRKRSNPPSPYSSRFNRLILLLKPSTIPWFQGLRIPARTAASSSDPFGKADQFRDAAGFGGMQPGGQRRLLVVHDHRAKLMDQGIGVTEDGVFQDLCQGGHSIAGQIGPTG